MGFFNKEKFKFGKLHKYNFMNKSNSIRSYLPDTRLATKANISSMLRSYRTIFLKPDEGAGGQGIYKLTKIGNKYILISGTVRKQYNSLDALYNLHHRWFVKYKYVAQKGIELLKYNKRPFDIRVMVQKNKSRQLEVTGIIGRLAKQGRIVTNYHSGGTPLPVETLLSPHLKGTRRTEYIHKMEQIGKQACIVLERIYRSRKAFGADIAIDSKMRPWILEVNTKPDTKIFRALKDKTMYKRVMRYKNLY
ncbi:YheC/YheD family protein [Paenibacillus sp. UNC451MF]|uniref:YheC/YheD family protein n=1 Tax=Paenibacillus sp. UNC451MF TaxID=1449063 RepID=UPI00068EAB6E|nr:YheC/YheD family protein [Paenibacillus sp. UNC451MF]